MPSEKGRAKLLKAKIAAKKRREKERKDDRLDEREVDPVKEAKASLCANSTFKYLAKLHA